LDAKLYLIQLAISSEIKTHRVLLHIKAKVKQFWVSVVVITSNF